MMALGYLATDIVGPATAVSGLACSPSTPAALTVQIGIGRIYSQQPVDATAYGDLPLDTTDIIGKQGILFAATTLSCPAPTVSGQSINYLIQAQYQDLDTTNVVIPYYNPANPSSPLNGEGGLGSAQPTQRLGIVAIQSLAGAAATTGTQVTPAATSGWTGLYVVTVAFGQLTIGSGSIAQVPGAPFINFNILTALTQASADLRYLDGRTQSEIAAGVTPVNLTYRGYPFHDIRRYGYVGNWNQTANTGVDDTAAWKQLALVVGAGGSGYVPPSSTLITAQVTFPPSAPETALTGYGCNVYTKNAIDALRINSFSGTGMTVKGFTVYQTDSVATSGFNLQGLHSEIEDCTVFISSAIAPSGAYAPCLISSSNPTNPALLPLWNSVTRFKVQQIGGGNLATYAPFGVLIEGECNVVRIERSDFQNVNYGVGIYNVAGAAALASNVSIDRCSFDGIEDFAVVVNGQNIASSNINGLTVSRSYFESCGGAYLFQGLSIDSYVPTFLSGNFYSSSVGSYISQTNVASLQVTVNTWEPSVVPNFGSGNGAMTDMTNAASFNFTNIGGTDVIVAGAQSTGAGIALQTAQGAALASLRYRAGGGAELAGQSFMDIQGVDGLSHTPGVRRTRLTGTLTFASSTTAAVSFGSLPEPDANYMVLFAANATTGFISVAASPAQSATGFTAVAANSSSQTIKWVLIGL
jgi:hypothetical protein